MIFCFSHANWKSALWNAFPFAFAQFSLFRLALFPFQLKASAFAAVIVVRLRMFSSFALQFAPETFSFYHELCEVLYIAITYSYSNMEEYYITNFKILAWFPECPWFLLQHSCCEATRAANYSGKY